MKPSQRIVINTVATYVRSILAAGLALFSIRWVLNALGQTDFGLYHVVGSVIFFITFLSSVMSGSAARYYAYYIGKGDHAEVNRWFNIALSSNLCLAFVFILMGWFVGEYLITHVLTVPADRVSISLWVFRVSLISAFVHMVSIPFVAMFVAKQHISELAVWSVLRSILFFALALFLPLAPGDRLLFYAIGMVAILVFIESVQVYRALVVFRECSIGRHLWFDKGRQKKLFSFASWNLIGSLGGTLRNQGTVILLNLFFGPKMNAAFGIANQVSGQANQLAAAMIGAFSPEITASEGRGDRARMISLSIRSSKFGTILVMLFAIPLMVEMTYILKLWLREPPLYTGLF
jgi:O-antigen/teichoic acid export membrane protein